jgi:hypothetical protein
VYRSTEIPEESALENNAFLKLHLKNGGLVVYTSWELDTLDESIVGDGFQYKADRKSRVSVYKLEVAIDDCVLAETNDPEGVNVISPLIMVVPTILGIGTIPCIFDPKACFGSCPTFYALEGDSLKLQAEGFSSSITKSLEDVDIDYLDIEPTDSIFSLVMKNEAYETHYIKSVHLLAFPLKENESIMQSDNGFYRISDFSSISNPQKDERIEKLRYRDGIEYFSESDPNDLSKKEVLTLNIDPQASGSMGVIITERQSLMTTFLFYQSIAYMGSGAGSLLASYEKEVAKGHKVPVSVIDMLGGIEVEARIDGIWHRIGEVNESGPIASDRHLLPIEIDGTVDQIRLTMVKGLWRIDEVSLVKIIDQAEPVVVPPFEFIHMGSNKLNLLTSLNDTSSYHVNFPGASDTLNFNLKEHRNVQLFLMSEGYYLEWIREDWLAEEDPRMVKMLFLTPGKWLKEMAPKYKLVEPVMEELFWSSKYVEQ